MTDDIKYSLLRIMKHNGDISKLINKGYRYSQLASLISELIDVGFAEMAKDGTIIVSLMGNNYLSAYEDKNKIAIPSRWINAQSSYWHKPIDKYSIYIPYKL